MNGGPPPPPFLIWTPGAPLSLPPPAWGEEEEFGDKLPEREDLEDDVPTSEDTDPVRFGRPLLLFMLLAELLPALLLLLLLLVGRALARLLR